MLVLKLNHVSKRAPRPQWLNTQKTLRPSQNCRHFADDIFTCIFDEDLWIPLNISLNFVPKARVNNVPALVQIMACEWVSEWVSEWVVYWFVFYSSPNHYDILVSVRCYHIYVYKETFPMKMHKFWLKFHSNLIWAYNQHLVDVGWFNVFVPNRHQENIWTWSHVYSPRHGIRVKSGDHSCMKVTTAFLSHYSNVKLSAIASEITGISIAYTTVCSGTDEK